MVVELILFGLLGLSVGSFLTLLVERLERVESFLFGRSKCNHCDRTLRWWELLPFAGYFIVRGRCPRCNQKIPHIYPFFEAITAAVFIGMRLATPLPVNYWLLAAQLLLASSFLALAFYDWLYQVFPTSLLVGALVATLLVLGLQAAFLPSAFPLILSSSLWGLLIGAVALGLLAFPSRGRWMGYGDVIISAILGLWVGLPGIITTLLVAFYVGAIVGLIQLATKRLRKDHHIAFGPFLIFGGFAAALWGPFLWHLISLIWGGA